MLFVLSELRPLFVKKKAAAQTTKTTLLYFPFLKKKTKSVRADFGKDGLDPFGFFPEKLKIKQSLLPIDTAGVLPATTAHLLLLLPIYHYIHLPIQLLVDRYHLSIFLSSTSNLYRLSALNILLQRLPT